MGLDAQKVEDTTGKQMSALRFLLLAALVLIIGWSFRENIFQGREAGDILEKPLLDSTMTEQVRSFSLHGFSESGEKTWEVEGKTADIFSDVIKLTDINADSYGKEITVNLKADKGVFHRKSNNIELEDNVVVLTDEGTRLTTQRLNWQAKEELVTTDEHVYIERKDADIEGVGASAKPDLKRAQLNKDVKVKIKEPPAVITCDGPLEVEYDNNIAYFYNNVKVDDGKAQIDTDKATAYFDPKRHLLTKVFCEGNVKIVRGEDITYAQKLTYFSDEGRVVLTGRPKIVIRSTDEMVDKI